MADSKAEALNETFKDVTYSVFRRFRSLREFIKTSDKHLRIDWDQLIKDFGTALIPGILKTLYVKLQAMKKTNASAKQIESLESALNSLHGLLDPSSVTITETDSVLEITILDAGLRNATEYAEQERIDNEASRRLVYESALITMLTYVELFTSQLGHLYHDNHPDDTPKLDHKFTYSELRKFATVQDARSYLIEESISETLRGSLSEWFSYLMRLFDLKMPYLNDDMAKLTEIAQRRHLLVHNDGRVNSTYQRKVTPEFAQAAPLGARLAITDDYLLGALDVFEKALLLIGADAWAKVGGDRNQIASALIPIAYLHIVDDHYKLALSLSIFIESDRSIEKVHHFMAKMNRWQCLKWLDEFEGARKEVESFDASILSLKFQLGSLALLDKEKEFFEMLEIALTSRQLATWEAHKWPIFKKMRTLPRFGEIVNSTGHAMSDELLKGSALVQKLFKSQSQHLSVNNQIDPALMNSQSDIESAKGPTTDGAASSRLDAMTETYDNSGDTPTN